MPCVRFLSAAALFATAVLGVESAASADERAAELLRLSLEAPKTVSYVGQMETVRFSSNRANATIVRVEHRAPASTRRWYLAPEALYGDYVITRGSSSYQFDTKKSSLTVSHNPALDNQIAGADNLDRVMANYRPLVSGTAIVAGRPSTSLVLVNKYTGERVMRIWVDDKTYLVLKKEEYHGNGAIASQTRFDELRYTNAIPDGIFSTDPPVGYTRLAGHDYAMPTPDIEKVIRDAGFKPITPKALPQGFALSSGDTAMVNGVRTLHLMYSDGLRTLSLFENSSGAAVDFGNLRPSKTAFEGHDAQYVEDGPTTLVSWKEKGLAFALVGDLLRNELIQIAKSVVP
ncbi:MAG: DUF4367 domain-containing protein [Candidatus Eremiobacteraeota bacterium]|nr:DUF4367 domain-containing protein [Candidatus Eremiobacteraeota bacterium]